MDWMIERRELLMASAVLAGVGMAGAAARAQAPDRSPAALRGRAVDLTTPRGNMEAWARLLGNTDMKSTKYGWAQGIVQGVRPGEAVRDLVGFTMLSCARLLPHEDGVGYRKVLREIGLYTDLGTGEVLETWRNPWLDEEVEVVHIMNDPFNHTITEYRPAPPSYGGLNREAPKPQPLQLDWTRRGNRLNMMSHINLFYPSALQPAKWPRESAHPFAQVTEMFLYQISWADMQNPRKTSVTYDGSWSRTTPWLPWMLMGPTPGHCQYHTFMGAVDDLSQIDRRTVAWIEKHQPKFLEAPEKWEEPSLSSLEWYARTRQPAAVPAGQPVPRAPEPELPAWFRAAQAKAGA
ncbi:DUF1838 family protein [Thermaurantiacus tibetensis]|uniref:DUF1838 family protein n=1 Tax=Thermaurantiacus tibetensis TaxID=2759035 RepID=UPI00188EDEC9|nr:DUF1838 family protein [Thermaurantiacus tibetensis]